MDREEFFRLKKVKGIKEKAKGEEEKQLNAQRSASDKENGGEGAPNLLGEEDDQDVIF